MTDAATSLRLRRIVAVAVVVAVPLCLVRFGGHTGVHMARNLLVPGAGVVDHVPLLGVLLAAVAVAATVAWLKWGADWAVLAVVGVSMAVSAAFSGGAGTGDHAAVVAGSSSVLAGTATTVEPLPLPLPAAHEFPLVVLVVGFLAWLRAVLGRTPGIRLLVGRRHRRRVGTSDLASLPPVDRCRATAVLALTDRDHVLAFSSAVRAMDVEHRARRVGLVARLRVGGDPFRRDHAHARAALSLTGAMDAHGLAAFAADADVSPLGVPCSEPGWIRPLDGTLAALALRRAGHATAADRWTAALTGPLALRRGHRPAWYWTPLGVAAGSMPSWEHAAVTGLARAAGWISGDDDWAALRRRALGAAARGGDQPDDERLIAAARLWLACVHDPEAERIVMRPGVRRDPLACALDRLAGHVRENAHLLHHDRMIGA